MAKILVVDDSETERRLTSALLSKHAEFEVACAENGTQALNLVSTLRPDLIVTDLVMPEMDGLELVSRVRRTYSDLPVILLTAHGSEMIAVKALEFGAASYLPKSRQADRLLACVLQVLDRTVGIRGRARLLAGLAFWEGSFCLDSNPAVVGPLVDLVQHTMVDVGVSDTVGRVRIGIALEEAVVNAIHHGNLELSTRDLAEAESKDGGADRLIAKRLQEIPYINRKLRIDVKVSRSEGVSCVVRHQGLGFDPVTTSLGTLDDAFDRGRNRGLMLMRSLMDEVSIDATGHAIKLVKREPQKSRNITFQSAKPETNGGAQ